MRTVYAVSNTQLDKWKEICNAFAKKINAKVIFVNHTFCGLEPAKLTATSEDLMRLSVEKNVPIIVAIQSNRTGAKDSNDAPELDTIRNNDSVLHNASKLIRLKQKNLLNIDLK